MILYNTESNAQLSKVISCHDNPSLICDWCIKAIDSQESIRNEKKDSSDACDQMSPFFMTGACNSCSDVIQISKWHNIVIMVLLIDTCKDSLTPLAIATTGSTLIHRYIVAWWCQLLELFHHTCASSESVFIIHIAETPVIIYGTRLWIVYYKSGYFITYWF